MATLNGDKYVNDMTYVRRIFDNEKYSDIVFDVNGIKFYASKHLVAASSDYFDTLINGSYVEKSDNTINMKGVKHKDSFEYILKSIYHFELDLNKIDISVVCEMLRLADMYNMTALFEFIKPYVNRYGYKIEDAVDMINTSKLFNMESLYNDLKMFFYENSQELIKHESFKEIQFDIFMELLSSAYFYAPELDLLVTVLKWVHEYEAQLVYDHSKSKIYDHYANVKKHITVKEIQEDCTCSSTKNMNNYGQHTEEDKPEVDIVVQKLKELETTCPKNRINRNEECNMVVSLLNKINFSRIPYQAYKKTKLKNKELFAKHKNVIKELFRKQNEFDPRTQYSIIVSNSILKECVCLFTINISSIDKENICSDKCVVNNRKCFIYVEKNVEAETKIDHIGLYLCLESEDTTSFPCTIDCHMTLKSKYLKNIISQEAQTSLYTHSLARGFTEFIKISDLLDPDKGYVQNDKIKVEVRVTFRS